MKQLGMLLLSFLTYSAALGQTPVGRTDTRTTGIIETHHLSDGVGTTFIKNYYWTFTVGVRNDSIVGIELRENTDTKPFTAHFFLKDKQKNYRENDFIFSHPKAKKIVMIYAHPYFSPHWGGEIKIHMEVNGEAREEKLYILRNEEKKFRLYKKTNKEKEIIFTQVDTIIIDLSVSLFLSVDVKKYHFN